MSAAASELVTGLEPIAAADASVLILGSLPSSQSVQKQQYYGNPQNAFWRIMGELFGARPDIPYAARAEILKRSGVAVWDVLRSATRAGSSDAAIETKHATANDFSSFFNEHPKLELLCFNGKKAAQLYARLVVPQGTGTIGKFAVRTMPSTSPAYASLTFDEKLHCWSAVRRPDMSHKSLKTQIPVTRRSR